MEHSSHEIYIAQDERMLDAMRKAAGGLIGVNVKILPSNSTGTEIAVQDAAEELQDFSEDWNLNTINRERMLYRAWKRTDGEAIKVDFDATNDTKNIFMWNAVNYLLNQGEDFDEPSREVAVNSADELENAVISTRMEIRAASIFARDVIEEYQHSISMPNDIASRYDRVYGMSKRAEATEAAISVHEEIMMVNNARAAQQKAMTPPKPGFRRSANDLLGIPEGTQPRFRNFGDELGQVMNSYHERRRIEEASYPKVVQEPAPKESATVSAVSVEEDEAEQERDDRVFMTIDEVSTRIRLENDDVSDHNTQTGDNHPYYLGDPYVYARNHGITIRY